MLSNMLAESIWRCRICPEACCYDPLPFIYRKGSPILIIGQNPGISHDAQLVSECTTAVNIGSHMATYEKWFEASYAYDALARYFGANWLDSGIYSFTNAVKCATRNNERPSENMILNCKMWTKEIVDLVDPKLIIMMGAVVRQQFGIKLDWYTKGRTKAGRDLICIKHYAARQTPDEIRNNKTMLTRLVANYVDFL